MTLEREGKKVSQHEETAEILTCMLSITTKMGHEEHRVREPPDLQGPRCSNQDTKSNKDISHPILCNDNTVSCRYNEYVHEHGVTYTMVYAVTITVDT